MDKLIRSLLMMTLSVSIFSGFAASCTAEAKPVIEAFRLPSTPFLPPYTGRIVSGDCTAVPQQDGGITYLITFETAEQPAQVLSWYKSAFQMYSWNLNEAGKAQFRLAAQRKNVESEVFLLSPKKAGAGVQVQLYYRYLGKEI